MIILIQVLFILSGMNDKMTQENPWNVIQVEDFLYYCCPECDERKQSKDNFLDHAIKYHSYSIKQSHLADYFEKYGEVGYSIKQEIVEDSEYLEEPGELYDNYLEDVEDADDEDELEFDISDIHDTTCPLCQKSFSSIQSCQRHVQSIHQKRKHKCDYCDSTFTQLSSKKTHMLKKHSDCTEENPVLKQEDGFEGPANEESLENLTCELCVKKFATAGSLRRHIKVQHQGVRIPCNFCDAQFTQGNALQRHMISKHPEEFEKQEKQKQAEKENDQFDVSHINSTICEYCNETFCSIPSCRRHVQVVHKGLRYKCDFCDKTYPQLYGRKVHMLKHHPDEYTLKYPEESSAHNSEPQPSANQNLDRIELNGNDVKKEPLEASFDTPSQVLEVKCDVDLDEEEAEDPNAKSETHACDFCGLYKSSKEALEKHVNEKHKGDGIAPTETPRFRCHTCGKAFETQFKLNRHQVVVHSNYNSLKCEICFEKFSHRKRLRAHIFNEHPNDFVHCDRCQKSFTKEEALNDHLKFDHANDVTCELCAKTCMSMSALKAHMKNQHRDPDEKKERFFCDQCGKSFTVKNSLREHINVAHNKNAKKLECEICHAKFNYKTNLQAHKKAQHSAKKQYQCDLCGQEFAYPNSLKEHVSRIHNKTRSDPCDFCNKTFSSNKELKYHIGEIEINNFCFHILIFSFIYRSCSQENNHQ